MRSYNPTYDGHPGQIKKAARSLARAKRPVLYVGGGAISADASPELVELAELTQVPVTQTLMGLGAFPMAHPLSLDMLGMHGTYYANMAVHHSDCLVAIGARFDDRVTGKVDAFSPNAEIIHIDIDPSSISKNIKVHIPIVGDCKRVLRKLVEAVRDELERGRARRRARGAQAVGGADRGVEAGLPRCATTGTTTSSSPSTSSRRSPTSPTGRRSSSPAWASTRCGRPSTTGSSTRAAWCTSGGLGTMGYGLPTAMGVQAGNPGKLVINIDGDGSFAMNSQELATCFTEGLPVKTVIINNSGHGMVRQWQRIIYKERYSSVDLPGIPDWVRLAEAYGCMGLRVTKPSEVAPAIEKMISTPGPVVLDVCVDKDECVFPDGARGRARTPT